MIEKQVPKIELEKEQVAVKKRNNDFTIMINDMSNMDVKTKE
jgi:hypothetical protein